MNSINFLYSTEQEMSSLIKRVEFTPDKDYFIRVHTCIHNRENIMQFVEMLLRYFPKARIIGSSASGVILEGDIHTKCCLVSVTQLLNSEVKTCLVDLSNSEGSDLRGSILADKVVDAVVSEWSQFMLTFFARSFIKVGSFVDRINKRAGNVQLIGGIANTPENPETNIFRDAFVFDNNEVSNNSVAAAVIDSKQLTVCSDIIYVTEPVGIQHTITDADGMIIRAIDGENAVEWYQRQLGVDLREEMDYNTTVLFPLVRSDHGDIPWALEYSPQNDEKRVFPDEPEPVMYVPSEAKTGERVRISFSSIQKTIEVCEEVCNNISAHPAEVLFGYSCVSRQSLFSNCAKWELMPFEKTNLSGALVAGEIGNMNSVNCYCNYSFAIAALAESAVKIRIDPDILRKNAGGLINKQEHIVKYLINANKSAENNEELTKRQQEIEESLFKDDDSGISNITKYSFDFGLGKFDKICMLTFRNEGLLTAFMSKSKFNMHLNRFFKRVMEFIDSNDYSCYVYKKTSLIITGSPQVCDGEFVEQMRFLQNVISDYRFGEYIQVIEFSIVMHEDDMINKAELTLANMRSKNILFSH